MDPVETTGAPLGDTGPEPPEEGGGGGPGGTPVMPVVTYPITPGSVSSSISAGGATVLSLVFATAIGFLLARKLFFRLSGAV